MTIYHAGSSAVIKADCRVGASDSKSSTSSLKHFDHLLKFCFKTCVAIKFVDDDDDDLQSQQRNELSRTTTVDFSFIFASFFQKKKCPKCT